MNKRTRKQLEGIIEEIEGIQSTLEELADEEQDKADNMPENMLMSEKHDRYEEISQSIRDAADNLSDSIDYIQQAIE